MPLPSFSSLSSCPTAVSGFLQRCTASAKIRTTSRDENDERDFWLVVRPRLARRAPPIHAESQFEHTGCIPVHTPKAICRLPKSHMSIRLTNCHAARPLPSPLPWHLPLPKNCDYNCKLALCKKKKKRSPRISQSPPLQIPIQYPTLQPYQVFPHPIPRCKKCSCTFSDSSFPVPQLLGVPKNGHASSNDGFQSLPVADWR
jgi:hypothetical protein